MTVALQNVRDGFVHGRVGDEDVGLVDVGRRKGTGTPFDAMRPARAANTRRLISNI